MNAEELQKLADLARISIAEDELKGLQKDMEAILKYVSQIQDVASQPQNYAEQTQIDAEIARDFLREDENSHETGVHSAEILAQAPETKDG